MITLQGIRLNQKGYNLYLTSATVEDIKKWFDDDNFFADIWKRERDEGYQRQPDETRYKDIAAYLEEKLGITDPILPSSLILNIKQKGTIDFHRFKDSKSKQNIEAGEIVIHDEGMPLREVDGQHRVRGLVEAYKELKETQSPAFEQIRSYPVPLTIIEGLDRPTEAMQFVVINSTQKKVDPALVLRILYRRYRDEGERLDFFLGKGRSWRLQAVDLCDTLNSDPDSPWCDKIIAPGDPRKGRVITEKQFVTSLETVYSRLKLQQNEIKNYVPLYWKAIASLWTECVGPNATRYSLQRSNGTVVFHWLFPFVYFKSLSLGSVKLGTFVDILKPIHKKFPPTFWQRGGEAKAYTSKGAQATLVDKMIASTIPGGSIKFSKFKGIPDTHAAKTWDTASRLLPLRLYHLFTTDKVTEIDANATGVYSFYSFAKKRFYVGRADKADLKSRLETHLHQKRENQFSIFNYRLCKEPKEAHDLECALYHLLHDNLRINKQHPQALEGRKCPFCPT